ncbi:hypothetical protein SBOR_4200 [Sclerotinia borealis F-4128]|uniref:Uncharacterized protein n=1 Tax=Sclerotinia borealis (strain F-4128) TaxID=1432307 RepID=W9CLN0_SCLBF|nr:hypothetical protein SBOR_4200 [Sclerotinia borealis F-4128]
MSLAGLGPSEESPSLEIQFIDEESILDSEKSEIDAHADEWLYHKRQLPSLLLLSKSLYIVCKEYSRYKFGNGSVFLASLGLNNSLMSLVWLSGPIAGAALQPIFGASSSRGELHMNRVFLSILPTPS